MIKQQTIIIDWIRHAESCANLDSKSYLDKAPTDYKDKDNIGHMERTKQTEVNTWEMPDSSLLKSTWKYQPNLSFIGMQQAILLGTDFINKEPAYDVVFASPTVRAIMTAMLGFRSKPNVVIYVVPYISEHQNPMKDITGDYQNKPVNSNILKRIISFMKDWLSRKWFYFYDDIEVINKMFRLKSGFEEF